ncbi:cytokine-induced anti-apoptosis inhibitor 1, Fe-S biogenesis-domain-containing protein [Radiomyces spectabilis]|uniref:cytokine-induced anti-apoptosis inhibitor 1, Fe-S biogenesis-domain-containing protein n=1 Tax=Radiomyces spectabilis TaxID=64574 RepID=UPI00221F04CC|nr:cytokine-induced anti-apoptosis inhibitor 1, Fe-S biogenesis-domain-containing protein [Radiomyces spectabilis]KAI8393323.1 cytokine-induced anti-apoptosis inhibitor 1, Fe-S biogenesis-domain-containing protein [Radiomyces spectabilis]
MVSSMDTLNQGDTVLFVAPSTVDQDLFLKAQSSTKDQVGSSGSVAFEVLERVADAPLAKASYSKIYSNVFSPSVSTHTTDMLSRYLNTLTPGGSIELREPVLLVDLSNTVCPITRKQDDLVSLLTLAGFVDVRVAQLDPVSDEELAAFFRLWGATRVEQGVSRLSGKFGVAHVVAKSPAYEIGQKMTLNFRKKANNVTEAKKTAWVISTDDDVLEDDDELLDEADKIKPSKESLIRPDDCEMTDGRRKACKNCTCGRAEAESGNNVVSLDLMDDIAEDDEIVEVDPTPKKTGGCGSCALGDAFRCSTCPYLGMPAFNAGEKIALGGMFGKDDIDF